jgi:tetratricopeptide (TPR) repeat protein
MYRLRIVFLRSFFAIFALSLSVRVYSQASFVQGEELFLRNRPKEAIPLLEVAASEDPAHVQASLYLGIAYQQEARFDDAIAVFRKILPRSGAKTALIAYNLGNVYYAKGSAAFADQYYSQALQADPNYASAYLNRANGRVKTGSFREALQDYEAFLGLEPSSPKRPRIEQLMSLIKDEFAAEELRQQQAAEQARIAAEQKQRFLDEVSASLQAAAEETMGLQAGSEDVIQYDGEFELD